MSKKELRRNLITRDGEQCYLCGCKTRLDIHHALRFKRDGGKYTLENCVLLCWECHHVKLHKNKENEKHYTRIIIEKKAKEKG